ncbi:sortase [Rhizomonospora bruguierae]|uniref:sortase n=1 Tax=Rhizomonospora bruguierae TaxID=1581705 RepID=UPI001BCED9E3|nr:sortase [Micromonospora sp. NBRC 107566]
MRAAGGPRLALVLPGAAVTILAVLILALVAHLTVISQLQYQRTQQVAYADFRAELARGTAPVGQTRVDFATGREKLVDPGTAVAVLDVPAIGLHAVVFEGTSGDVLRSGPGHRRDTVLPGQAGASVVMGRRAAYGAPFRDLDLLLPGDLIFVTTGQSDERHQYRVIGPRRPGDPVPQPPAANAGRLTLITALGPAFMPEDSLRVDADLVSPVRPAPRRVFGAASLPAAEQVMGTDPGAWTPLMLWGQALLLAALGLTYFRLRWGRWQTWLVGVPVLGALALAAADQAAGLLPNLL